MATAKIIDNLNNKVTKISTVDFPYIEINLIEHSARITEILPFRVKFSAIQIERLGIGNTPAIPLQVIGYSNYIL